MEYDKIEAVRRSDLWELRKSPAHYKYAVEHPEDPTPALKFGTAAHMYILEPERFKTAYMVAPKVDRRTKDGKEVWAKFLEELGDRDPITEEDWLKIQEMNKAINENPTAWGLLKTGRHEVPIEWRDETTNVLCKCRPDCLTEIAGKKYIVDYKTTQSCEDGAFERACRIYGYKLQAGMYTSGVFYETLEEYSFAFVAQEKAPPYAVRVYFCDSSFVDEGIEMMHDLLGKYAACCISGCWPGYEDGGLYGDDK